MRPALNVGDLVYHTGLGAFHKTFRLTRPHPSRPGTWFMEVVEVYSRVDQTWHLATSKTEYISRGINLRILGYGNLEVGEDPGC